MENQIIKTTQNNSLMSFNEMKEAADIVAESKLFPMWDSSQKVMTLMMICKSEGIDPVQATMRYDFINGRISKRAQAILDDFVSIGGKVNWIETTDKIANAEFVAPNGSRITESYTIEDAKQAGLLMKDNWKKYPRQMLRARCISSALRAIYPSSTNFLYTPEEVESFEPIRQLKKTNKKPPMKKAEPVISETTETKANDLSEFDKKINELGKEKTILYLKSIKWINKDLSDLDDDKKEKILGSFNLFSEKVQTVKIKESK